MNKNQRLLHDFLKRLDVDFYECLDDAIADQNGHAKIDETRNPVGNLVNLMPAFLVIIIVEASQGLVELPTDFAGVIEIGEHFGELGGIFDGFGGNLTGWSLLVIVIVLVVYLGLLQLVAAWARNVSGAASGGGPGSDPGPTVTSGTA